MNGFEYYSGLQYRVKAQAGIIREFESGERYLKLKEKQEAVIRERDRKIRRLEKELAEARQEILHVRKLWFESEDDLEASYEKIVAEKDRMIKQLREEKLEMARQWDAALDKCREKQQEIYRLGTRLEDAEGQNKKLTAQINKDFENSSLPSSLQGPRKKKIPNSRVRTGRKPGGQPGHKGHCRKKHPVTETHEIPAPDKYRNSPDYYETGKIIRKQRVAINMSVQVTEYTTKEYRNRKTGTRVHAAFPKGYVNEVNYDGTVKALAFLLGNECNVSHGKIRKLISELTDGEITLSDGMINGLCEEFSAKTGPEKKEIIRRLMTSPVMNADFTNARVNGSGAQVLVLASPSEDVALYIGREKKGHEGIKGTPLENYVGIVVHDHDLTFYNYGTGHQECIQHDCRYLIGSKENEPEREWNHQMYDLIREMLHYRNSLEGGDRPNPEKVREFEGKYDKILDKAEEEYEYEPPGEYYKEGYNLYRRLKKYKESELRFLHDMRVPANNSLCERLARVYKRKQKQAITLRSQKSLEYICDGLSIVYLLRSKEESVYKKICDIYSRKRSISSRKELTGTDA